MAFISNLSESKSSQVSRTVQSILTDLTSDVIWWFRFFLWSSIPLAYFFSFSELVNRKKCTFHAVDFAIPADHRVKTKTKTKKQKAVEMTRSCQRAEKDVDLEVGGDCNYDLSVWNSLQSHQKETVGAVDQRKNKDYSTFTVKKSLKDLITLAVSQISVKTGVIKSQ